MKYFLLSFLGLLLCTCCTEPKRIDISTVTDIPLMPYIGYTGKYEILPDSGMKWEQGGHGYVNADTFEVVIPAQYQEVLPFVGDYAIILDFDEKFYVINKDNKKIFTTKNGLNRGKILKMENSDAVVVLTIQYSGREQYTPKDLLNNYIPPKNDIYKLYNLSTGKQILKYTRKHYSYNRIIMVIDDYIILDNNVYKLNNIGKLDICNIMPEDLIKNIAEERNMSFREKDFKYFREENFVPFFGYHDNLDIDLLLPKIPNNLQFREHNNKTVFSIEPLDRIEYHILIEEYGEYPLYPLQNTFNSLYAVYLVNKDNKKRYFAGLYNASENDWAIYPVEVENEFFRFYKTHFENYVKLENTHGVTFYYSLKTRKKYKGLFDEQKNYSTKPFMKYLRLHQEELIIRYGSKYKKEYIIEDF